MPVILTTPEEVETWLTAPMAEALQLQRPLPGGSLRIVARGEKKTARWRRSDMAHVPTGKFMMPAIPPGEELAFIVGGEDLPKMIPESEYRAAGYEPPFDLLPTLEEFERAQETNGAHEPDASDEAPE